MSAYEYAVRAIEFEHDFAKHFVELLGRGPFRLGEGLVHRWHSCREDRFQVGSRALRNVHEQQTPLFWIGLEHPPDDPVLELFAAKKSTIKAVDWHPRIRATLLG